MTIYAESSAVAAWLLDEEEAPRVRQALDDADVVVASALTIVECDRVLVRAVALGELSEPEAALSREHLTTASSYWHVIALNDEVLLRARRAFPVEPIRTLDALHLASAVTMRILVDDIELLSLDHRVRDAGTALGFRLQPR